MNVAVWHYRSMERICPWKWKLATKAILAVGPIQNARYKMSTNLIFGILAFKSTVIIGPKSLIGFTLWEGSWGFRLYLPQTWTDLDETWNISEWSRCALTQKIRGKSPQGFIPKDAKTCFVFVTDTTRTFGHLSCTDFDRFWNKRRESMSACVR